MLSLDSHSAFRVQKRIKIAMAGKEDRKIETIETRDVKGMFVG